jgi:hypothetical protein
MFCHEDIDGSFILDLKASDPDSLGLHAALLTPE